MDDHCGCWANNFDYSLLGKNSGLCLLLLSALNGTKAIITHPVLAIHLLDCGLQVWMIVLRYFAGVMAWTTVIAVNIFFIGFTFLAFERSGLLGKAGEIGKVSTPTNLTCS